MTRLGLARARAAAEAVVRHADEMVVAVSLAVVDAHGAPVLTAVMDDALLISPGFAQKKAFTALTFRRSTHEIALADDPLKALRAMTADPRLAFIPGGSPICLDGVVVGAVGVAGGTAEQDRACCEAALRAASAASH